MKEFEPSRDFVWKVMQSVRASQAKARAGNRPMIPELLLSSRLVRVSLSAGGAMIGIINLIRISLIFLSPTLCR
ncbi:MAG: hypothetical protein HY881_13640 [Deltaproteobacteria bacterium]|nr:hypothetical protein [Deltaproteobacteria bacterium]